MNISDTNILVKALAATRSAVTITDNSTPDNHIVYCNTAFLELTGYDKDEVIGRNCRFLQGSDTEKSDIDKIRSAIRSEKDSFNIIKNYTKDGRPFWNELQISPVYDESGALTHFIGLQTDVTMKIEQERAKNQARKLKMENELLALEKDRLKKLNDIKDDFISVASHQLRTPATVVKQYLAMLGDGLYGDLTQKQKDALHIAYESNDRQLSTIDKLLNIARIDADIIPLSPKEIVIETLLTSVVDQFKYQLIEKEQTINIHSSDPKLVLSADEDLIRTVFENIIDNAIKYSHAENTIDITVSVVKKSVHIDIKDTGIGMNQSSIDKLFNKFTRIENLSTKDIGGTGLGLYWAKKVMDMHKGTIKIISTPGEGTTFCLTFPYK